MEQASPVDQYAQTRNIIDMETERLPADPYALTVAMDAAHGEGVAIDAVESLPPASDSAVSSADADWDEELCIRTHAEEPDMPATLSHIPEASAMEELGMTDVPQSEIACSSCRPE